MEGDVRRPSGHETPQVCFAFSIHALSQQIETS